MANRYLFKGGTPGFGLTPSVNPGSKLYWIFAQDIDPTQYSVGVELERLSVHIDFYPTAGGAGGDTFSLLSYVLFFGLWENGLQGVPQPNKTFQGTTPFISPITASVAGYPEIVRGASSVIATQSFPLAPGAAGNPISDDTYDFSLPFEVKGGEQMAFALLGAIQNNDTVAHTYNTGSTFALMGTLLN